MALAIQSVATTTWTNTDSVVITKPTGLAVGDLLFAVIGYADNGSNSIPDTPSGWTLEKTYEQTSSRNRVTVFSKIADASDVSASDFTFEDTVSNNIVDMAGVLYRIDDFGDELVIIDDDRATGGTGTSVSATVDIDIPADTAINIILFHHQDVDKSNYSAYSVTGITNPTWTERFDQNDGVNDVGMAVADAITTASGSVTAVTATATNASTLHDPVAMIVIVAQQDASASPALLDGGATIPVPTAGGGTSTDVALLTSTPTVPVPTASVPTPDWTNVDANDAVNVTNVTKS